MQHFVPPSISGSHLLTAKLLAGAAHTICTSTSLCVCIHCVGSVCIACEWVIIIDTLCPAKLMSPSLSPIAEVNGTSSCLPKALPSRRQPDYKLRPLATPYGNSTALARMHRMCHLCLYLDVMYAVVNVTVRDLEHK